MHHQKHVIQVGGVLHVNRDMHATQWGDVCQVVLCATADSPATENA